MPNTAWKDGERQVAKKMEQIWGVKFYRSESSGGLATSRRETLPKSVVDALTGDVICDPKVNFPFSIEVKTRKNDIDLLEVCRLGKNSQISKWWQQACRDAMRSNKLPLLWFKTLRKQWYVGIDSRLLDIIYENEDDIQVDHIEEVNDLKDVSIHMSWKIHGMDFKLSIISETMLLVLLKEDLEDAISKLNQI